MHGNIEENSNLIKAGFRELKIVYVERWLDV